MRVLVTGGAGFIGSHTTLGLLMQDKQGDQESYEVVVVDNFSNSSPESLKRVMEITGKTVEYHDLDLRNKSAVKEFFDSQKQKFDAVVHFAALKAVGESVQKPLEYYENNLTGALNLLECMRESGCKAIVFSSSATVYGNATKDCDKITEDAPISATNPYGRTKLFIEEILRDLCKSDKDWKAINLRYFNPVGAHESGRIGEDPAGIPNNLMPYVSKVAVGKLEYLTVHGNDYPTPDGTGVRDYIHVMDLAEGHIAAIKKLSSLQGEITVNLGTGRGYSVVEMVEAMRKASGAEIPYKIGPRREGDVAMLCASTEKAKRELGWVAKKNLEDMCNDLWRWQSANPNGYRQ
ncbi:hypothetical protein GUITHDRAFT_67168 [Guillardia theta CCMP2712]|uniref:UDP-glucose 4-epimerase n=1 Tax=Guillardia theta (strain CCMP2712) TaxID=905079 RepID=L1JQ69_GUITC|nr:hypothetical protein GUITHDRAFT_67168 [Guillardia theta CCMP2712]EKX50305.1 hypothetical protein GUITHDRAFT_67168 [Guillardia theta CCMP2712]|eukprot:XP_005837285.1 hypothetical protein GUITHDRAFT_67168 [Guillardia theta CCMP2712]